MSYLFTDFRLSLTFFRYPRALSDLGYNVLNIHRAGYGGNPPPSTPTPILDSVSLITALIAQVHHEQLQGQNGIILVGHSIGAAIALAIAAQSNGELPLLGVSSLGLVPTSERGLLIPDPDPDPDAARFVIEDVPTVVSRFFGPFEFLNEQVFNSDTLQAVFEPSMNTPGSCKEELR